MRLRTAFLWVQYAAKALSTKIQVFFAAASCRRGDVVSQGTPTGRPPAMAEMGEAPRQSLFPVGEGERGSIGKGRRRQIQEMEEDVHGGLLLSASCPIVIHVEPCRFPVLLSALNQVHAQGGTSIGDGDLAVSCRHLYG